MTSPVASERIPGMEAAATRSTQRRQGAGAAALAAARVRRGLRRQWLFVLILAVVLSALGLWFHTAAGALLTPISALSYIGAGIAVAVTGGVAREVARNTVTSVSSLGKNRGYTVMGAAPDLTARALRQLPPDQRSPLGSVINDPASQFATAFRDLQFNLAKDGVVAFIGSFPGDGATTSALCAAASATQQGASTIILDCDVRRRSLTRGFGLRPELGVMEACERPEYWRDYVEEEHETGLHFLPAAKPLSPWRGLAGQPGFPNLLQHLREAYDLVILDCPPALSSAEGGALARLAQRSVVVAVWDQTPIGAIRHTMRMLRAKPGSSGVFVNRVPPGYRFGRLRPD